MNCTKELLLNRLENFNFEQSRYDKKQSTKFLKRIAKIYINKTFDTEMCKDTEWFQEKIGTTTADREKLAWILIWKIAQPYIARNISWDYQGVSSKKYECFSDGNCREYDKGSYSSMEECSEKCERKEEKSYEDNEDYIRITSKLNDQLSSLDTILNKKELIPRLCNKMAKIMIEMTTGIRKLEDKYGKLILLQNKMYKERRKNIQRIIRIAKSRCKEFGQSKSNRQQQKEQQQRWEKIQHKKIIDALNNAINQINRSGINFDCKRVVNARENLRSNINKIFKTLSPNLKKSIKEKNNELKNLIRVKCNEQQRRRQEQERQDEIYEAKFLNALERINFNISTQPGWMFNPTEFETQLQKFI